MLGGQSAWEGFLGAVLNGFPAVPSSSTPLSLRPPPRDA
jgi:hypothetical protein